MATLRLSPPAWITEVDISDGNGVYASHTRNYTRALMTDEWVAGAMYGIDRKTGMVKWQAEPNWRRCDLVPFGVHQNVLVATRHDMSIGNLGVYRFDITTGEPLWIYRSSEWIDKVTHWIDRRVLRTVEHQIDPFEMKNGEIISTSGAVISVQTGFVLRYGEKPKSVWERNAWNSSWRPGVYDVEGNVGTIYYGTPSDVRLSGGKSEWFLRRPDDTIAWSWEASSLNSVIGADVTSNSCHEEFYKKFLFLLFHVHAETKGYFGSYAFLAVQDLRNGEIVGLQKISDVPVRSPKIDFIDDKGILIRAYDAAEVVKQDPKKNYIFTHEAVHPGVIRLFYLPSAYGS